MINEKKKMYRATLLYRPLINEKNIYRPMINEKRKIVPGNLIVSTNNK